MNTQLVTVLVGPPACGKSTYLKTIEHDFVISSDNIVDSLCREYGLNYHQYFELERGHEIKKLHHQIFDLAVENSKQHQHVVWDLTHLTKKARAKVFSHYPQSKFNAVVFDVYGIEDDILALNRSRAEREGKFIKANVIKDMLANYQEVSHDEGFTDIKIIQLDWLKTRAC